MLLHYKIIHYTNLLCLQGISGGYVIDSTLEEFSILQSPYNHDEIYCAVNRERYIFQIGSMLSKQKRWQMWRIDFDGCDQVQYILRNMHTVFALLWLYIDWFSHIHQAYFSGTVAI